MKWLVRWFLAELAMLGRQARCDHAGAEDAPETVCPKCGLDCDVHLSW